MKPDIVFFGEGLPDEFHHTLEEDKTKVRGQCLIIAIEVTITCPVLQVDLLIVMGSSLKVRPVSLIPSNSYCTVL